ncbi:hypothetical protein QUF72_04645 [Desulfobacterales bacterium HSG2]|nr:hypothetical protein [Desulfobacterales bacterium HSG2]
MMDFDLILLIATSTEKEELKKVAMEKGIPFEKRKSGRGSYYYLGKVGSFQAIAVRTEMGPLGYGGSASKAIHYQSVTSATAIVQLGMAFGVWPDEQKLGDVLVSNSLLPYDNRDIIDDGDTYLTDYSRAERYLAKSSLIKLFQKANRTYTKDYRVFFGTILSGSARIFSAVFRDELLQMLPQGDKIIGGEMEAMGLLSISPPKYPIWIVVKGISDFANKDRNEIIKQSRPLACRNAASFVLNSLLSEGQDKTD